MDKKPKASSGILGSLKKLIFEDDQKEVSTTPVDVPASKAGVPTFSPEPVPPMAPQPPDPVDGGEGPDLNKMKIRVLDLLEKLNEEGIDFFEVWNAAAAMGTVDATTLKAAVTSLKYADKSLTKEKLLSTGNNYAVRIQEIIDQDVAQKQQQKETIQANLINEKQALEKEISDLEAKIKELQTQLGDKQKRREGIDNSYDTPLKEIDLKISCGKAAVKEVVNDIHKALSIIEKNIN